jgi:hypothetical protein
MPNPFGSTGSGESSTYRAPSTTVNKGQRLRTVNSAGRISVDVSNPTETIAQSANDMAQGLVGVGKGLVSIAENLPVVGAIAKPVIGGIGTIADATIGQVVGAVEKSPIGGIASGALGAVGNIGMGALELISAPGRFTEQKIAEARIRSTQEGRYDAIRVYFGDAPAAAVNSVRGGASIEDAALQLANSNAGFSENGAMNFLYSLVIDPLNLIAPGAGKAVAIGAEAATLNRIGVAGLKELAAKATKAGLKETAQGYTKQAEFLEKWGFAAKVYEETLGKLDRFKRNLTSNIAKESATAYTRVYAKGLTAIDTVLSDIGATVGLRNTDQGLRNVATTFANAIKSSSVRARAAIVRSNAKDFSDNLVTDAIGQATEKKTLQDFLATELAQGGNIGDLLKRLEIPDEDVAKMFTEIQGGVASGLRAAELRRTKAVSEVRQKIEEAAANARVRQQKDLIRATAEYKAKADARLASEDAFRVLSEAKLDRVPAATDTARGIEELASDLAAGFGIKDTVARQIAEKVFKENAGDIRTLTDVLAFARDAAYGQAVRELAAIRKAFKTGDFLSRITITSTRSLTESNSKSLIEQVTSLEKVARGADEAAAASAKAELKQISDNLVRQYDEFGVFAGSDYTYSQVLDFLKKSQKLTVREITSKERAIIASRAKEGAVKQLTDMEQRLLKYGYRLGIAPDDTISTVRTMVVDHNGREAFTEMVMPFSDTLDHVAIKGLDDDLASVKLRPSKLSKVWEKLTRPYGVEVTKNNIAERFVSSMVQKTGVSVNTARRLMSRITDLAAEKGIQPKALYLDRAELDQIFKQEMGDVAYGRLFESGTTPIKEVVSAAAGDWSVSGLTSGFTGRVKAIFPEITVLTDRFYPDVRFGRLNPFFNLVMERVETKIQLSVYGIKREVAEASIGDIRGTVLRKAHLNPASVHHEINDGVMRMQARAVQNTSVAIEASGGLKSRVSRLVRPLFSKGTYSIDGIKEAKEIARDIMSDQFAVRTFMDTLEEVAPGKIRELAEHYGVTKAEDAIELLLADYLIQSDPLQFAKYIESQGPFARSLAAKALREGGIPAKQAQDIAAATMAAYELAIQRASRAADKAQYFASHRSWFERSINHPFLGLYPYSYMTQKAIPSLLRIMFVPRIGGVVAPGLGYAKWENVLEWTENSVNSDEDVLNQLLQNDALIYLASTLLPVTPDNSGFSMPTWLRRGIIQPGLRGDAIKLGDIGQTMTEVGSQFVRGTVLGQGRTVLEGIEGIDKATRANERFSGFLQNQSDFIQEKVLELRGQ